MTMTLDDRADWLEQYIALHEGMPSHADAVAVARRQLKHVDTWRAAPAAAQAGNAAAPLPQPNGIDLCRELRQALRMPFGALPITPRAAWDEAIERARTLAALLDKE